MSLLTKLGTGQGYLKAGFLGFQASGKTYTACSLAIGLRKRLKLDGPIAMFDTEGGSEYIAQRILKETGKTLMGVKSQSFQDLLDMALECEMGGVSVLIADSMTHVWRELCDSYLAHVNEERAKKNMSPRSKLEFQDWNPIKKKWSEWTQFYLNSSLHIIICGRAGYEYEMEMNQETNRKELIKTGVKMKTETEFGFEPSLLIEMERVQVPGQDGGYQMVHHATIVKDRFGVMDGAEADNPTFDFFLPHIALLTPGANAPIDMTKRTPMHVDEIGQDQFDRMRSRQKKAWEEIENGLAIIYPSSQGKDKQARYMIFSELTGSTSELKIQSLPPDQLERIALAVREFGHDVLAGTTINTPPKYVKGIYDRLSAEVAEVHVDPLRPTIPQVRPQSKPEDGAGDALKAASMESRTTPQQASDAPAQSAAEFARRKAEEMPDDPYVDGFVTNWQPYSGTKRNEKGKRPGQFDLDDGQETIVMKWIKYFDPAMEEQLKSGGLKRVFYKEDTYNGKTQYQAVKVESVE